MRRGIESQGRALLPVALVSLALAVLIYLAPVVAS